MCLRWLSLPNFPAPVVVHAHTQKSINNTIAATKVE